MLNQILFKMKKKKSNKINLCKENIQYIPQQIFLS